MKENRFIENVLKDWKIKVICFIIAIFIYIFHQASIIQKKAFIVPVTVIENGHVMNVGDIPNTIIVNVRTNEENINRINISDLAASIKIDSFEKSGEYEVPVNINISSKLKEMDPLEIKVKPEFVKVKVEEKAAKYVKLVPSIVGEVAKGYKIEDVSVNPSTVEVRGSKSAVENTDIIYTTKVNVSNASTNFSVEASYLEIDKRISLDTTGPYKVTIRVSPLPYEKNYSNVTVGHKNLSENLEINSEISKLNIKLSGIMPVLEKFELNENNVYLDCSNIDLPGTYELPVLIKLPSDVSLNTISSEIITVNFVVKTLDLNNEGESLYDEDVPSEQIEGILQDNNIDSE